MSGNLSTSTNSNQPSLDEMIKMPANLAQALAVLVQTLQSDIQLIGAVLLAIILILVPVLFAISAAPSDRVAILLTIVASITIFLVLTAFLSAYILIKFREQGKRTFAVEHREDLQDQLLHSKNALLQLRYRIGPLHDSIMSLINQGDINEDRAQKLRSQLNDLMTYLEAEERAINAWLGRIASAAEMNLPEAARLRKMRWDARKKATELQQQVNQTQNRQS